MKLGRFRHSHVTTPSYFLHDPDFSDLAQAEDPAAAEEASENASVSTGPPLTSPTSSSATTGFAATGNMGSQSLHHAGSYWDLSPEARDLDSLLYNVLRMCVKGSKRVLLECVQFPSYIQAVIVLMRHHDISRNDRITQAFDAIDQLSFNGDVSIWQAQVVHATRELFESGASVMHYVLTRIMKSFNGKLKTIQYRIAEDINQRVIDDNTNIYDMVQKYAVEIASVGDSKTNVNMASDEGSAAENTKDNTSGATCTYCGKKNHTAAQCYKKKRESGDETRTCHTCGVKGHISPQCPQKSKRKSVNHVVPAADPVDSNTTQAEPGSGSAPVTHVNADGAQRNARDAQLRTDLAAMLSRLYPVFNNNMTCVFRLSSLQIRM